jgi:hypothetical protein
MNQIVFTVYLLIGAFLACKGFAADPREVDLWPGKTPGDVGINGQENSRIHPSPIVGPTKLITNVTKPTLTIYQPAKDKDEIWPGLRIPANTPPIPLAHASDDSEKVGGSNAENSAFMYIALKRAGIPVELHIYASGDHDFGVRQNDKLPSSWPQLCVNWLHSQGLLKPSSRE